MEDFPLGDETYEILGVCFEVYNEMGCGFLVNFGSHPDLEYERIVNQRGCARSEKC